MNSFELKEIFTWTPTAIQTIYLGILTAVFIGGAKFILKWLNLLLKNFLIIGRFKQHNLSGHWFSYETNDLDITVVNFNKVIQRKHKLFFSVWQYTPSETQRVFKRYFAEGVKKDGYISAYFYNNNKNSPETGAMILKEVGSRLSCKYIQYSLENEDQIIQSIANYELLRTEMPLESKLRMFFNQSPFKTTSKAFEFIENEKKRIKWRSV